MFIYFDTYLYKRETPIFLTIDEFHQLVHALVYYILHSSVELFTSTINCIAKTLIARTHAV